MKKLFLIMLLLNVSFSFAFENVQIPGESSRISSYSDNKSVISSEEYDVLEKKIFKKTYSNDSAKNRLSRLEKEIFGMEQKGDEEERFENLITASDYYSEGYRQNQSQPKNDTDAQPKTKINPKDYIVNYNFEEKAHETVNPGYSEAHPQYYSKYASEEPVKKQSKIKQFFENIVDALAAGAVTGYTLPIDSFGIDPFNGINSFGGSNYIGLPQFPTYYPQRYISPYRYNRANYPYVTRNNYYNPPPQKYNYNRNPYGSSRTNYNSGSSVRIIY